MATKKTPSKVSSPKKTNSSSIKKTSTNKKTPIKKEANINKNFLMETENVISDILIEEKKVENIETNLINSNEVDEIDYATYYRTSNPFIFKSKKHYDSFAIAKNKKFKFWYNFAKFSVALVTVIFSIIALYFASIWQSSVVVEGLSFDKDGKIPVDGTILFKLFNIDINQLISKKVFTVTTTGPLTDATIIAVMKLNIWDINNSLVSYELMQVLFAFGIIGIISSVFLLIFKNGTIYSFSLLILSFISFIISFVIFVLGLQTSMHAIGNAQDLTNLLAVDNSTEAEIKTAYEKFIANFNLK